MSTLPPICGDETAVERAAAVARDAPFSGAARIDFGSVRSCAAIALHMHQPLIPAGGDDLPTADIIGNLQFMTEHPEIGDNHNAPVFLRCYRRMAEFIPQLVAEGNEPRVMLEYSGTLFHGLAQMGAGYVLDDLRKVTCDPALSPSLEWLGAPWGHAVAPSTPVQDYRLHVGAWRHHFAVLFGPAALGRVRGFSPSEMALPNHPDVAFEFVRTLRDFGYTWVLVQEHTVEQPLDGRTPQRPHIPHRLICRNSKGEEASIVAVVKTQGSDTKLVAQMQPYYEAKGLARQDLVGRDVPPLVTQIADGENGGVMMNEFPGKYLETVRESRGSPTRLVNVSEYLDHLFSAGIREADLPALQPVFQKAVWDRFNPGEGPETLARVIGELRKENPQFHVEGGSWTNNLSWVHGYDNVLGPMEEVSTLFHEKVLKPDVSPSHPAYRNALFHLLACQTSCYRYWGQGLWTDYGREICRRALKILNHDF